MPTAGAPKKNDGPSGTDLVAGARLEPSLRFRFSLIALGRGDGMAGAARTGRATTSGLKRISPRCFARATRSITARGVAYHLDAPWRPADVEQREGRVLRQGNTNAEVQIFRYVTEQSFDAYSTE
jgi:hypothetical protein